ncbi:MAG: filamentous hemagglutinin N-terminal domain-containing protein, partial [Phycisphaerales bacterium]|nr:filamentous hemagglutinin N-terminal domain-containing protein [Phycisphaerales bacterium]
MKTFNNNAPVRSATRARFAWARESLTIVTLIATFAFTHSATAGVGGIRVTRGNVSFSQDGNRLIVHASNGAIIEYDRFSVEAGQIMQFIQPHSRSRVLNRVTGSELTRIDGTLLSNGIVYLINPQGFRIGNGAVINVGGFFAAAGAMSNADFKAGRNRFTNLQGEVVNEGAIHGQAVALVGQYVANRGTIDVDNGVVAMAAGDTVLLQRGTAPVVISVNRSQLGADGSAAGTQAAVSNTGTINAGGGSVSIGTGDFYALAMDLSGSIIGKSIAARGGRGGVVAVNGTLDASNSAGKGGTIDIFGERVGLFDGAVVNASGTTGGGSIRIGGDFLGTNAAVAPHADRTYVDAGARVEARATQSGNGGRVIIWSDEYTGFFGAVDVSAAGSGRGGFVETSSHDNLQAFGSVNASSAQGAAGMWLLDPSDVLITNATANGAFGGGNPDVFTPNADNATVDAATINASLNAGTSVTITTESAQAQTGNITMDTAISMTAGGAATLTLVAAGSIILSADISSTLGNDLSVILSAGGLVTLNNAITTQNGALTLIAGGAISQGVGSILTIGGDTSVTAGAFDVALGNANDFGGAVAIVSANNATITDTSTLTLAASTVSGSLAITASDVVISGALSVTNEARFTGNTGVDVFVGMPGAGLSLSNTELALVTAGSLAITASGAGASMTVVAVTGGGGITLATTLLATDGVSFSTANSHFNNALTVMSATTLSGITISTSGDAVTLNGAVVLNTGAVAIVTSGGNITFNSSVDFPQALSLTAGSGTVTLGGGVGEINRVSSLTVVSAGEITITDRIFVIGAVSFSGDDGVDVFVGTAGGVGDLSLTDAELDFVTDAASMNITAVGVGASMTVNGVTGGGTIDLGGMTTLRATDGVTFMTNASNFSNALTVQAGDVTIDIALGVTGELVIAGNGGVDVFLGTAGLLGLSIDNAELALITADDLSITSGGEGASMTVNGVTGGGAIAGTTTLTATDGVTFETTASTFNNALTIASTATISGVNLTTSGDGILFSGAVALGTASVVIDTAGGTLTFDGTVGGTGNLTLTTGAGSATFNGQIALDGAIDFTGQNLTLLASGSQITGTMSVANGGLFTLEEGATITCLDAFTQTGMGTSEIGGSIFADGDISFATGVTLTADAVIHTFGDVGDDIFFASTIDGAFELSLFASGGTITFTGEVGGVSALDGIAIQGVGDLTIGSAVEVTGLLNIVGGPSSNVFVGTAGTGLSIENAELALITAGSLSISANGAASSMTVNGVTGGGTIAGTTTLRATDGVTFMTNASNFSNALTVQAGDVTIDIALGVTGQLTVAGNGGVDVFLGTAGVGLSIDNVELARITAGSMSITGSGAGASMTVNGVAGGGTIAGTTTLTATDGVTFETAASSFDNALTIASDATLSGVGLSTTGDALTFNGVLLLDNAGTIASAGGNIEFAAAVEALLDNTENLIVNAGAGTIAFAADVGSPALRLESLSLTATTTTFGGNVFVAGDLDVGNVTLSNATIFQSSGTLTIGEVTGLGNSLELVANALNLTGLIGDVSTLTIRNIAADGNISIAGAAAFDLSQAEWNFIGL